MKIVFKTILNEKLSIINEKCCKINKIITKVEYHEYKVQTKINRPGFLHSH